MSRVFVIAEAACTWLHGGLEAAYRSIRAAKDCDADAWKTQWTSDPVAMHKRRGVAGDHYKRLAWPREWLPLLKAECDRVGIEFMVTTFIPKDVHEVEPFVDRFKVSNFEGSDEDFLSHHLPYEKPIIISSPPGTAHRHYGHHDVSILLCTSRYPCPLEEVRLQSFRYKTHRGYFECNFDGLSDHSTSTLTGAVAVGAGSRLIEKHIKLANTPQTDPDYGHSLEADMYEGCGPATGYFRKYVENIREAESML